MAAARHRDKGSPKKINVKNCDENAPDIVKGSKYVMGITGMTHEGQGVGRVNGFTVFVDGAVTGEKVEVIISKVAKSYAVGLLIDIFEQSAKRASPFCQVYGKCGGCSLQHLNYEAQLEFKTQVVKDSLKRIGHLANVLVHDTIGMQNSLNYRNKAQYPVTVSDGRVITGFYASRTHELIESRECAIQYEAIDRVRSFIGRFISDNGISVYNEISGKGLVRHIMVRAGFKTGDLMAVIVINGSDLPYKNKLIMELTSYSSAVKSIVLNINTRNTNIILGEKNIVIYGEYTITDYIGKYKFKISPLSFFQVNPIQTEILYGKVLEYTGLSGNEVVFDLYCGAGTISLFISEKAKKVYGVEVVEEAVSDAKRNALINDVTNVEFILGEAEKIIPDMYKRDITADVVVVDPPRKGCGQALLDTLARMRPERIVYVSCNPATLARDLGYLEENGFSAIEAQPVDMFPWTEHVECVIMMTYCGSKGK